MDNYFCIHSPANDVVDNIVISEQDYINFKEAKDNLIHMLYIEEKYNFIIENFLEFEKDIISITFEKMVSTLLANDWILSTKEIHLLNRRLINLLTTSRLYIDQLEHDLKKMCLSDPNVVSYSKMLKTREYNENIGYRVIEALRNYVQHRGLPIHSMKCKRNKQESFTESSLKYIISPLIRVEDLEKDDKFKKSVIKDLKQFGENVDLKLIIREYIQSISNIHCSIRQLLSCYISEWDSIVENAYLKYKEKYSEVDMIGVAEIDKFGFRHNNVYLLKDTINKRKLLIQKNSDLSSLVKMYVSSEY